MLVCMCVREGVTTGQPLASEPVDLIGQKKMCPLVEPSLGHSVPVDHRFFSVSSLSLYISFNTHSLYFPRLILLLTCMASRRGLHPPREAGALTAERLPFCF